MKKANNTPSLNSNSSAMQAFVGVVGERMAGVGVGGRVGKFEDDGFLSS